jgi:hypothetical protein
MPPHATSNPTRRAVRERPSCTCAVLAQTFDAPREDFSSFFDASDLRSRIGHRCPELCMPRAKSEAVDSQRKGPSMIKSSVRSSSIAVVLSMLVLAAAPAWAVNEQYESSCGPSYPCAKPPKENLCFRQVGDLGANGEIVQAIGALAKGKKGTMVKVDMTFEWFSLSNQFRPFNLKLNNKFPINFLILNHLDSCPSGFCLRHATTWFDIDQQELVYPTQFYNQPLIITLDSAKTADANSQYNVTICASVLKKK